MADEAPKKLRLSKSGGEATEQTKRTKPPTITDPMSLRDTDTSRLKRIKPQSTVSVSSPGGGDEFGTETVHLKVIKEKKKQLAGILSASQTIRLRPSSGEAQPTPAASASPGTVKVDAPTVGAPVEAPSTTRLKRKAPGEQSSRATLKLKAPQVRLGDAKPPAAPATAPTISAPAVDSPPPTSRLKRSPNAAGSGKATLKLKAAPSASAPGGGSSTLKIKAPAAAAAGAAAAAATTPATGAPAAPGGKPTLKLKAAGTQTAPAAPAAESGSKATLRLKAPTGVQKAAGPAQAKSSTLRIKAPATSTGAAGAAAAGAVTQAAAPAPAEAGKTVKQEAPKPGRTLKLKTRPKKEEPQPPPGVAATAATGAPGLAPAPGVAPQTALGGAPAGAQPGWLFTFFNVLTAAAACGAAFFAVTNYKTLFMP